MDIFLALVAAPLWILAMVVLGIILMVIAAAYDRRGVTGPKWYIFAVALIAVVAAYWPLSAGGMWDVVTSWTFWGPMFTYLAIGLAYSVIEFGFLVRRAARVWSAVWKRLLDKKIQMQVFNEDGSPKTQQMPARFVASGDTKTRTELVYEHVKFSDMLADVKLNGDSSKYSEEVAKHLGFLTSGLLRREWDDIIPPGDACTVISASVKEDLTIEPAVVKSALVSCISAWTFFWPAYALSLLIGDFLTEVFNALADFLTSISGRFVRMSFSDVFKA